MLYCLTDCLSNALIKQFLNLVYCFTSYGHVKLFLIYRSVILDELKPCRQYQLYQQKNKWCNLLL